MGVRVLVGKIKIRPVLLWKVRTILIPPRGAPPSFRARYPVRLSINAALLKGPRIGNIWYIFTWRVARNSLRFDTYFKRRVRPPSFGHDVCEIRCVLPGPRFENGWSTLVGSNRFVSGRRHKLCSWRRSNRYGGESSRSIYSRTSNSSVSVNSSGNIASSSLIYALETSSIRWPFGCWGWCLETGCSLCQWDDSYRTWL